MFSEGFVVMNLIIVVKKKLFCVRCRVRVVSWELLFENVLKVFRKIHLLLV